MLPVFNKISFSVEISNELLPIEFFILKAIPLPSSEISKLEPLLLPPRKKKPFQVKANFTGLFSSQIASSVVG